MSAPAVTPEERETLSDYERGFLDGVWLYSWWKDGTAYVGTSGRTYADAADSFLNQQGRRENS